MELDTAIKMMKNWLCILVERFLGRNKNLEVSESWKMVGYGSYEQAMSYTYKIIKEWVHNKNMFF